MWERYGFYVIQTLLIFYLLDHVHLSDNEAYVIVSSFTALAYINSIFGGVIADRLIGMGRTLLIGGVLLIVGYSILSVASSVMILDVGLSCITIGTGLLKPNLSSMLSVLYPRDGETKEHDPHGEVQKASGYTMYYVGLYIGVLLGSFVGGYLQSYFGFKVAYLSAAIGGLIAVITFLFGQWKFKLVDHRRLHPTFFQYLVAIICIIGLIGISYAVLNSEMLSVIYFGLFGVFCLGYIVYCILTHHGLQRNKFIVFLILVILSVCYWGVYFQQFLSISLCMVRACANSLPASSMPAIESLGVVIFGFVLNYVWYYLHKHNKNLSIPAKFSLSFLFNSICFLLLLIGLIYSMKMGVKLGIWIIVVAYAMVAIGELCISPTSLAMVTSLVPERLTSIMMGISLLSIGFGAKLAGVLASTSAMNKANTTLLESQHTYITAFFGYFLFSVATYIVSVCLIKQLRKLAAI
jgi:POT family proton-dependent oligopeptide transporter